MSIFGKNYNCKAQGAIQRMNHCEFFNKLTSICFAIDKINDTWSVNQTCGLSYTDRIANSTNIR